jgi:hypothetical protein
MIGGGRNGESRKAFSPKRWEANMTNPTIPKAHSLIASDRIEGTVVGRPDGSKLGSIERTTVMGAY